MKFTDTYGQQIVFDIPDNFKKIGINLSGGADSSILLLMLADYLIKENRTDVTVSALTCANDKKHRWNVRKAADVINYVIDNTGFTQFDMHYSYYRPMQEVKHFHEIEAQLYNEHKMELLISGITANPQVDGDDAIVYNLSGKKVDITADGLGIRNSVDNDVFLLHDSYVSYYQPFVNVDKRMVAHMYRKYDAEKLFDLTRSCEAVPDPDGSFDPHFEEIPCGKCWWCLERKWGFGRF